MCVMCLAYFNILDRITELDKLNAENHTPLYLGDPGFNFEASYTNCDCSSFSIVSSKYWKTTLSQDNQQLIPLTSF